MDNAIKKMKRVRKLLRAMAHGTCPPGYTNRECPEEVRLSPGGAVNCDLCYRMCARRLLDGDDA